MKALTRGFIQYVRMMRHLKGPYVLRVSFAMGQLKIVFSFVLIHSAVNCSSNIYRNFRNFDSVLFRIVSFRVMI